MNTLFLLGATLGQRLAQWNVILGLILIIVGILMFAFSKRVAMIINHEDEAKPDDKVVVTLRLIGFCLLLIGLVVMIIQ